MSRHFEIIAQSSSPVGGVKRRKLLERIARNQEEVAVHGRVCRLVDGADGHNVKHRIDALQALGLKTSTELSLQARERGQCLGVVGEISTQISGCDRLSVRAKPSSASPSAP